MNIGIVEVGAGDEQPVAVAHERRLLHLGSHHDPRRVAQHEQRDVEGVEQLHEARRLVGAVAVDGAGEVGRVVGEDADGLALDAGQRRHHAEAEVAAQLEHGAGVGEALDDGADVVGAQPVGRDDRAQHALVGARPLGQRALEVAEVLLGHGHALGLVAHADVDDAAGQLHVDGADLVGREHAEAAAFDHGRAAHADVRVLGGDDHVAGAEEGGVAGEAVAGVDADRGHHAVQPGHRRERGRDQRAAQPPGCRRPRWPPVRLPPVPARPPPPSVKKTTGQAPGPGDLQHAVGLRVVDRALGAGQHRVVVGQHRRACRRRAELGAVDAADAAHHAVGGELADDLLDRQPGARRQDEAAVLDERALVAQVGDVLARGALVGLAAPRHGVGPGVVEEDGVTLVHLGEVGADLVEVDLVVDGGGQVGHVGRLDEHQRVALEHGVADGDADEAHEAGDGGRHDVLHLHRFHDEQLLAGAHGVALGHGDLHDGALERRAPRAWCRPGRRRRRLAAAVAAARGGRAATADLP